MSGKLAEAFWRNFLGHAPDWYKGLVIACLAANPLLLALAGPVATSWFMLFEFIVTLMMALRCYPLQPGGLTAIEATLLGLVTPAGIQQDIETGLPVILLLMFMVAGIFFLREMLVYTFTKLLVRVHSNTVLALLFVAVGALLSAFLDALTVLAVMITVAGGFNAVYHRVASGKTQSIDTGMPVKPLVFLQQYGFNKNLCHIFNRCPQSILLITCQCQSQQAAIGCEYDPGLGCKC